VYIAPPVPLPSPSFALQLVKFDPEMLNKAPAPKYIAPAKKKYIKRK
jgi:hypothetical protein